MKKIGLSVLILLFVFVLSAPFVYAMNINSQAAVVIDFETGEILFEKDAHSPRVPASMTKAVTAFVVFEEIEAGNLTMDTMIEISENAARISSDTNMQGAPFPLAAGSAHSVDTLLHLLLLPSSNGAAVAFAEHISGSEAAFAHRMNESSRAIGMFAEFNNAHGALPHYTTAASMGLLVREFILRYPDILYITGSATMQFQGRTINNTNLLLRNRPFSGADGFRTGTTREAGFSLAATAERDGARIITVVMAASSDNGRYGDTALLLEYGFEQVAIREQERAAAAAVSAISVMIEDTELIFENQAPVVVDDALLIPIRRLFEALGHDVSWDEENRSVVLTIDSPIHDYPLVFTIPANIIGGYAMIALDVLANDILLPVGYDVRWDEERRIVLITPTPLPHIPVPYTDLVEDEPVFTMQPLPSHIIQLIDGSSFHAEAPFGFDFLTYLTISHWDFEGNLQQGHMIVAEEIGNEVLEIFEEIFHANFPIERMRLIDFYNALDYYSMADNNTVAFNFRTIAGTDILSRHAFGMAIDINPIQNPYIRGDTIWPAAGIEYIDRENIRPGMITPGCPVYTAFTSRGWIWGGSWASPRDYHHFERR